MLMTEQILISTGRCICFSSSNQQFTYDTPVWGVGWQCGNYFSRYINESQNGWFGAFTAYTVCETNNGRAETNRALKSEWERERENTIQCSMRKIVLVSFLNEKSNTQIAIWSMNFGWIFYSFISFFFSKFNTIVNI